MTKKTITTNIKINHITKVEGHADVDIIIRDNKIEKCSVHSVEGARYFEGIIKGRKYDEIPLITSRICGICSCAHTVASIRAIENAYGMTPTRQTELIRELLTIGERIRSHASHLYLFCLPDYIGYSSALDMSKKYPELTRDCFSLINSGNAIINTFGGREIHPYTAQAGGTTSIPKKEEIDQCRKALESSIPLAEKTIEIFSKLKIAEYKKQDTIYVSTKGNSTNPLYDGGIISSDGTTFSPEEYKRFISECFHPGSTSKFATMNGKEYITGAISRIINNPETLSQKAKDHLKKTGMTTPKDSIFNQNLCQAIEIIHWLEIAIEILKKNGFKNEPIIPPEPKKKGLTRGISAIEAPRGMLFHDYTFNKDGILTSANIITPTTQNLPSMETHLEKYLEQLLEKGTHTEQTLRLEAEKLIRAFDPCYSCSTHFLIIK